MSEKYIVQRLIEGLEQAVSEMEKEAPTLTAFADIQLMLEEAGISNLIPKEILREGVEIEAKLRPLLKKYAENYRKLVSAIKQAVKEL